MIQVTRRLRRHARWKLSSCCVPCFAASLGVAAFAQVLPPDAQPTCTVASAEFAGWFTSGTPALNGVVNPANSITFVNSANNCIFYKWSEQMFMWLASPAPSIYGGGDRIFNSPVFYDVSPPAADGSRTLIPHVVGLPRFFPVRVRASRSAQASGRDGRQGQHARGRHRSRGAEGKLPDPQHRRSIRRDRARRRSARTTSHRFWIARENPSRHGSL